MAHLAWRCGPGQYGGRLLWGAPLWSAAPDEGDNANIMQTHTSADTIADAILRTVGKKIVLGLPLGLGKAPHIANALYARAKADPSIRLTIFTALTLEKPRYKTLLEQRFLGPVIDRLFGAYPEFAYVRPLRQGTLPPNIEINEFFFLAGQWLNVPHAQQSYISANYTHATRFLLERGMNVIAQLVAKREDARGPHFSLSGNTDLTLDVLKARAEARADFIMVGQVNSELPFMPGEAVVGPDAFAHMLDDPSTDFPLFAPPSEPVSLTEYATGLHAAALIEDGGTLQLGIGRQGDAAAQALILRKHENAAFNEALAQLVPGRAPSGPIAQGLHGVSEMFAMPLLGLIERGVLARAVDGILLHAAFFLGPKAFYKALREMPPDALARIHMAPVSFTNQLYGDEAAKQAARVKARFINSTMMATLLGAAVSDGFEDGRVVSGVGGQYDFVAQAFALPDARSILTLKAARGAGRNAQSNIRFNYGHETVPRHLRDVFVTEYGVADLRGRTDAECVAAMLAIADSRFQDDLLRQAKEAGKIAQAYEIPADRRENTPERIARALAPLREKGLLPAFPFGSDFDETEQALLPVLGRLNAASASKRKILTLAARGVLSTPDAAVKRALDRLSLAHPSGLSERISQFLVRGAMAKR